MRNPEDTKRVIFNCPEDVKNQFDLFVPYGLRTQVQIALMELYLKYTDDVGLDGIGPLLRNEVELKKCKEETSSNEKR